MKKLLIATNVLFLGLAVWFYFQANGTGIKSSSQFATAYAGILGGNLSSAEDHIDTCGHCIDYTNDPFGGMPAGLAATMLSNYTNTFWRQHQSPNNYNYFNAGTSTPALGPDARSIWFSLDTLKKFIWHIENEVCKNGCMDKASLGIRLYYGQYPNLTTWNTYDQDPNHLLKKTAYQQLHSAFLVPTYFKNSRNIDFDPRFITVNKNGRCIAMSIAAVMDTLGVTVAHNDTSFITAVSSTSPGATAFVLAPNLRPFVKNDGSLIPPPPPNSQNSSIVYPFNHQGGATNGAGFIDFIDGVNFTY